MMGLSVLEPVYPALAVLAIHLSLAGVVYLGLEKILLMNSWRLPGTDIDTLNRRPREFRRVLARFFLRWGLGFTFGVLLLSSVIAFLQSRGVYSLSFWAVPLLFGATAELKAFFALSRRYPEVKTF